MDVVGDLLIVKGKIANLGTSIPHRQGQTVIQAQGMVVSAGFVDLHCHLREPGFEEKETIATGTEAAARGGFTTVCCMPNTNPTIDTPTTVRYIDNVARREGKVRVLPIGCISRGQKGKKLADLEKLAEAGVVGFSDDGNPTTDTELLRRALEYGRLLNLPIIDHCEDVALVAGGVINEGPMASRLGLKGIPATAEEIIVERDLALAESVGAWLHIAHVSTARSVKLIREAKQKGIRVTSEVTPHHITLTEEAVLSQGTNAKVNPPLRTRVDTAALIQGIQDGTIDTIATDHAPHTLSDKQCDFAQAAFGISGLETALGSLIALIHDTKLDYTTLVSKLSTEPARFLERGSSHNSHSTNSPVPPGIGTLRVGAPADVVIFNPEAEWIVRPENFASKGINSPWIGHSLKGKVLVTLVGGQIVYRDERIKMG